MVGQEEQSEVCESGGALCEQLYDLTGNEQASETVSFLLGTPLKIVIILIGALLLNRLGRRWAVRMAKRLGEATEGHSALVSERSSERSTERGESIGSLLRSLVTLVVFGLATIMILGLLGIDAAGAVASAGVLAIAIGFGAQSVVADLFAGLFMLTEDQFGVGDRIDAGPVNGFVERITLRTTVIRDADGKMWHVPNSKIDYVANETQSWARAVVVVGVAYSADLQRAVAVLEDAVTNLAESADWAEHVEEVLPVQSVYELGADSVDLRVLVRVAADQRRAIERALRLRCKEALDGAGIEMPNRQVDIHLKDAQPAATRTAGAQSD